MSLNPLFLFVLFSLGYVFGLLLRNPTAGKFLIFGFMGIFVYEPVKEAGLLASAVFLAGIIAHHVTPSAILDILPRVSLGGRYRSKGADADRQQHQRQRQSAETTEDTHRRYEEYVKRNRGEEAGKQGETKEKAHQGGTSRPPPHREQGRDDLEGVMDFGKAHVFLDDVWALPVGCDG